MVDDSIGQLSPEGAQLPATSATPQGEAPKAVVEVPPEGQKEAEREVIDWQAKYAEKEEAYKSLQSTYDRKDLERQRELEAIRQQTQYYQQQAQIAALMAQEKNELQEYGETPEVHRFQEQRRMMVAQQAQQVAIAPKQIEMAMRLKSYELAEQYGVDSKSLFEAKPTSPEAMELLAKNMQFDKLRKGLLETTRKPQVFDTGSPSVASGAGWRNLSADDKIRLAIAEDEKRSRK